MGASEGRHDVSPELCKPFLALLVRGGLDLSVHASILGVSLHKDTLGKSCLVATV